MPRAIGSLKTEEKTERQCGQRGNLLIVDVVCQFRDGFPSVPNKNKIKSETGATGLFPPGPTDFPERRCESNKFLTESLILAQDERWRRA